MVVMAQDIYLTGNPQITFFKSVYRRHTNFANEQIQQTFNGTADFGKKVSCTISRNGDLIGPVWLVVTLPSLATSGTSAWVGYTNSIGHAMIDYVECQIGGQRIDKHYGEWMEIWCELTQTAEHWQGFCEMIGKYDTALSLTDNAETNVEYYVPLQFWFCRNPGLALPLIALQYHEVKIEIEFRAFANLFVQQDNDGTTPVTGTSAAPAMVSCSLWVEYTYLDTDERKRFAQVAHEYLIDQLQFTGGESVSATSPNVNLRLNYNHPVKELVFAIRTDTHIASNPATGNDWFNFSYGTYPNEYDPLASGKIQLNGHDRFATRNAKFFRLVQPYEHHTRIPSKFIYVYSFGLKPEEHQPSGTCNFSRIDNSTLVLTLYATNPASTLLVYAVNYNVLRIMSGEKIPPHAGKSILPILFQIWYWVNSLILNAMYVLQYVLQSQTYVATIRC